MTTNNTKSVIVVLLIVCSICSYIYLNTFTSVACTDRDQTGNEILFEEEEAIEEEVFLPDVRVLQKALRAVQRFVPASS